MLIVFLAGGRGDFRGFRNHGAPLGRRTRPEAAHAAPEIPWYSTW